MGRNLFDMDFIELMLTQKNIQKIDYGSTNSDVSARIIIHQIIKDKYGVVWIATWGNGLTKFDPLREPFNFYKFITNDCCKF